MRPQVGFCEKGNPVLEEFGCQQARMRPSPPLHRTQPHAGIGGACGEQSGLHLHNRQWEQLHGQVGARAGEGRVGLGPICGCCCAIPEASHLGRGQVCIPEPGMEPGMQWVLPEGLLTALRAGLGVHQCPLETVECCGTWERYQGVVSLECGGQEMACETQAQAQWQEELP